MQSFARRVCVCEWETEGERDGHIGYLNRGLCVLKGNRVTSHRSVQRIRNVLTAACVQTHTSFITVSVTRLCSSLRLELMLKLSTLFTVFTFKLKAKARDLWKGALHFRRGLWCRPITMHCTVSVGQSEQTALVWRRDFVENEAFERQVIENLQ